MKIPKTYNPKQTEKRLYNFWEKSGFFTPKIEPKKESFTIIMPPPNVNAPLHIGHALTITLEDIMTRYHRMLGQPTLWLPGADHAGIATQTVFERKLAEKGKTRHELGRKKFSSEIKKFTLKNKEIMERQIRALGASCDWTRNSFTLDPRFNKPVYTVFKKLHKDGLIYRSERMIHWCPRCQTALSDLEVEYKEEKSNLWYIRYPLKKKKQKAETKNIVVATTRPETMLGDTAVAVNPEDKRYKKLIGKTAILPLMNREIPIITDKRVDPEFGTGAVKVTPAHDPVDFEIGKEHNLETIRVIGFNEKMTKNAKEYSNLKIKEARERILAELKELKLLEKEENYTHSVGFCERCKSKIEPQISLQWFVKMKPLAKPAIEAVKERKVEIIPGRFKKIYFNWLKNIKDWCISRQIWWGHRIPVWYCGTQGLSKLQRQMRKIPKKEGCGQIIISQKEPRECPKCGKKNLIRDSDTLDTWFSSGQWPFNTLGWIENSRDFQYFYPTSVMETGYDILFFWVARMVMLGLYVTGKVPFKTVYLHGMVRDVFGRLMSKSRPETCINPMESIEKYGADALRMALIFGNAPGSDLSLTKEKVKGMRNFANKIWNASRFVLMHSAKSRSQNLDSSPTRNEDDKWILKELKKTRKEVTEYIEDYRFDLAAKEIYQFFWHKFCDKYIEKSKKRREEALPTLLKTLKESLILLHPFMPFITEEIYQKLPNKEKRSIMIEKWP